ncbi:Poly(A)+ RNA export protein rae1 [Mortierella sp. NVP85]|nr:Poly(A)+ RNA export protein rae1 [Mortierella sp. NVP85]
MMKSTPVDMEVQHPPTDGISEIQFSPQADFLAASSWDNNVRIYEIQPNGSSVAKAMYSHTAPVLCCAWSKDGTKLVSGGTDKIAKVFDISTGQSSQVAQHDAPIKEVRWVDGPSPILATGSWDKTIKYWDIRQPNPVATLTLPERLYTMDSVFPLLVAGTADRHIIVYHLNNPNAPFKATTSPLKWQTRTVSCFNNGSGYAIGSIEGRVAIQYVDDKDAAQNFSFKCHREGGQTPRDKATVYSVNSIQWHPVHGTFSTAGSDGTYTFWDKDSRQKLKSFPKVGNPISSSCFNRNGKIFAYAVSYDWNKGHTGAAGVQNQNKIMLHAVDDDEAKPRKR